VVALFDGENGRLLALMDSIEITILRTGAATAVAAKYLARRESSIAAIFGCGRQGKVQLRALTRVLSLKSVRAFDVDSSTATGFAAEMEAELGIKVRASGSVTEAAAGADVFVACTPSRQPYLLKEHVAKGAFVAAVGADSPDKLEIDPKLMASSVLVADVLEQCAHMGDLRGAIAAGTMRQEDVYCELGDLVAARKPGRTNSNDIAIFDSTGTAIQDVAAAVVVYGKAIDQRRGLSIDHGRSRSGRTAIPRSTDIAEWPEFGDSAFGSPDSLRRFERQEDLPNAGQGVSGGRVRFWPPEL
jgi:ornithine cyclodeaminase/alanine dehydrogenase